MKRFLSYLLLFSISLTSLLLPASAANTSLETLAENTIQVSKRLEDSGAVVYTYTQIDTFVNQVHEEFPYMDDLTIAKFVADYFNMDTTYMPDERILQIIQYNNLSISQDNIYQLKDGTILCTDIDDPVPYSVWNSSDGYMTIQTWSIYEKTVNGEDYFLVSADAKWYNFPKMRLEDKFVLGTNATFDDSYTEYGSAKQVFYCSNHAVETTISPYVTKNNLTSGDLRMEYESFVPVLCYNSRLPYCSYGDSDYSSDRTFYTSIGYRIITNGSANIQAGYAHKTVGVTGVSVSISADGAPGFSAGIGTVFTPYIARAVTVKR